MPPQRDSSPAGVVQDPSWFPASIDGFSGRVGFVRTNRVILSALSFVDGREPLARPEGSETRHSLEVLAAASQERPPGPSRSWNFIFHTGFCCSTLLASCLDREGACLALKEPGLTLDLAEAMRCALPLCQGHERRAAALALSLDLLARPFAGAERVVIKPSNAANALIPEIAALEPASRFVFLRPSLKEFLIAVAKGGQPRRRFARRLLAARVPEARLDALRWLPPRSELFRLNDLQIAAVLWAFQVCEFESFTRKFPNAHVLPLECETLLKNPHKTTARVARFFGLPPEDKRDARRRLARIMARHAKGQEFAYGPEKRRAEFRAIEKYLGAALEETLAWAERNLQGGRNVSALKMAI